MVARIKMFKDTAICLHSQLGIPRFNDNILQESAWIVSEDASVQWVRIATQNWKETRIKMSCYFLVLMTNDLYASMENKDAKMRYIYGTFFKVFIKDHYFNDHTIFPNYLDP